MKAFIKYTTSSKIITLRQKSCNWKWQETWTSWRSQTKRCFSKLASGERTSALWLWFKRAPLNSSPCKLPSINQTSRCEQICLEHFTNEQSHMMRYSSKKTKIKCLLTRNLSVSRRSLRKIARRKARLTWTTVNCPRQRAKFWGTMNQPKPWRWLTQTARLSLKMKSKEPIKLSSGMKSMWVAKISPIALTKGKSTWFHIEASNSRRKT